MANTPATIGQQLEAIQINGDGELFLASSQLSYRQWNGSLWRYTNPDMAPDVERCDAGYELSCGVHDLKLIPNTNRMIAGLDSGGVLLLETKTNSFEKVVEPVEHDSYVSSISVNADCTKASSASQDKRIKIWDLEEFASSRTFKGHYDAVHSATFHPRDPNLFASCSQDGHVILWDLRKAKPATLLDTSALPSKPTSLAWQPACETGLAVGTESGHVVLLDTTDPASSSLQCRPHDRTVTRIEFSAKNPTWFATSSEDCTAVVTEYAAGSATPIYRESGHCDFVTGIAWHPDGRLFTCGWDQRINKAAPYPNIEKQLIEGTKAVNLDTSMDTVESPPPPAQE